MQHMWITYLSEEPKHQLHSSASYIGLKMKEMLRKKNIMSQVSDNSD